MTQPTLFVYGTLQDHDILGAVLGRSIDTASLRRAKAPGFRAVTYPGRVYPALVARGDDAAPGLLFEVASELDLAVLDAFEGGEYQRQTITVLVDGALLAADAYLPVAKVDANLPAWSLAGWAAQHKPDVVGQETGTASALRQRLSARIPV